MTEFEPTFQTDMTISAFAKVSVSERAEQMVNGGYDSTDLLDGENDVELSVGIAEDQPDGTVSLRVSTFHAREEESGRVFHFHTNVDLSWRQIADLHRFLAYLLSIKETNHGNR